MAEMTRPVLEFVNLLYPGLREKRVSECTPEESIAAGIAWLADNSEHGIDDAARKLIDEFKAFASKNKPEPTEGQLVEALRPAVTRIFDSLDELSRGQTLQILVDALRDLGAPKVKPDICLKTIPGGGFVEVSFCALPKGHQGSCIP